MHLIQNRDVKPHIIGHSKMAPIMSKITRIDFTVIQAYVHLHFMVRIVQ